METKFKDMERAIGLQEHELEKISHQLESLREIFSRFLDWSMKQNQSMTFTQENPPIMHKKEEMNTNKALISNLVKETPIKKRKNGRSPM